jgi:hypothetical protein
MSPTRIQLSRAAGWRKPDNAVVVSRPSKWGNPFVVGVGGVRDRAHAVELYRQALDDTHGPRILAARRELAGKDLACWCPLDQPCHADVLLELANPEDAA